MFLLAEKLACQVLNLVCFGVIHPRKSRLIDEHDNDTEENL